MIGTNQMNAADRREWKAWLEQKKYISSATAPPEYESPAQQRARIEKALKSIEAFAKEYLSAFMDSGFAWFHKKLFKQVENDLNAFAVCEWPREHGKSVIVDVLIPMYLLAKGKLTGMILASSTEPKAKGLLKDIQAQLESNRRFIHDFGDQRPIGAWADGHFTTTSGVGFWAFGIGQNPAGVREAEKRPNYGVIDDADDKRKAKNQKRVQEDVDWILGEFLGCLSIRESLMVYANNRVHKAGLTAHIVGDVEPGDPKREDIVHIKAYATENPRTHQKLMPEAGGVPSWPRYTIDHIVARMKRMGYSNAMRQFYHEHQEQGNVFTIAMIKWIKPLPYKKYDKLISYLDPSWKDKSQNDFKAIVLLGKTGTEYHILWAWVRQAKVSDMVNAHYLLDEIIGDDVVCQHWMEANLMQDTHVDHYRSKGEETGDMLRLRLDKRKKPDKVDRIADLEPLFQLGLVKFNMNLRADSDMQRLVDQFLAFPYDHDDGPDAVEGAIYKIKGKTKKGKFNARMGSYKQSNRTA